MRRLWGDDAEERMGGRNAQELDEAMDEQVAGGVFAPVLGRDPGAGMWVPGDPELGAERGKLTRRRRVRGPWQGTEGRRWRRRNARHVGRCGGRAHKG